MRVHLLELGLVFGHRVTGVVEDEEAGASGPIVNGPYEGFASLKPS
jgi:hypothetical protein